MNPSVGLADNRSAANFGILITFVSLCEGGGCLGCGSAAELLEKLRALALAPSVNDPWQASGSESLPAHSA